jgi:hypothetical protein
MKQVCEVEDDFETHFVRLAQLATGLALAIYQ